MDAIDLTPVVQGPRNAELHFDIDLLNKCNLLCPTCFRGVGAEKNTSQVLPVDHFREIVAKARAEGYPNICLINWTEAFLLKNLDEYVRVVKEYPDLDCWISSNLSLPPERYLSSIISALATGVDLLFVSVSGWTQETYEINHKAGRVDWVKQNVAGISRALRDGRVRTNVWIRYLQWPYNEREAADWARLAGEIQIGFDAVPAYNDPRQPLPKNYREHIQNVLAHVADQGLPVQTTSIPDTVCALIMDRAAIDAKGDAYLCCAFPNAPELRIGRYTDMNEGEFLLARHDHPYCKICMMGARNATEHDRERFRRALTGANAGHCEPALSSAERKLQGDVAQEALAAEEAGPRRNWLKQLRLKTRPYRRALIAGLRAG
jgi:MoaA/NifB/PqqE/SkfB family radical SAM enzyme